MKIHFIRKSTYIIYLNNKKYLVNPYFGESETPLPVGVKDILKNVEAVILTDNFSPDSVTEQRIKQKGIRILTVKDADNKDISGAIEFFNSLKYKPSNGEILLS